MVIDASVAFKLVVEEPHSEEAIAWIGREELLGPTLIHAEVGNALWKQVRNGELADDGELSIRLGDLARYIRTVEDAPLVPRALELALELARPVYDCLYLALAEAAEDRLLTADRRMVRALASTPYGSWVEELGS